MADGVPRHADVCSECLGGNSDGDDRGGNKKRRERSGWPLVKPDLTGLEAGPHGVHVHENPDCSPSKSGGMAMPAGAAGGHFDPEKTGRHGGPYGDGHLGDLPNIFVEQDGTAKIAVLAPRLRVAVATPLN